ncbi:Olfactory receptor 7E24 [Fukomys damarensis]|uniref:Olfactory receptor 7E24 n=1 Tax=Fukomys damarensis TaxID=885580 RepID=A0A091DER2_FUKDA|nr:Olfactory receptor 7E24 [Fukomys damarensis]
MKNIVREGESEKEQKTEGKERKNGKEEKKGKKFEKRKEKFRRLLSDPAFLSAMRTKPVSSLSTKALDLKTFVITQQSSSGNQCSSNTKAENQTLISEFHLLGFSEDPDLQPILFGLFLSMYLVTVLGNLLIILAVSSDSHLHTPMYFFLSNLSLADICFTSTMIPKMIMDILTDSRVISYVGCLTQMYLFIIFICMDDMLLTVMAYDRFVAICHPLQCPVIMNPRHCGFLIVLSFLFSLLDCQLHNLIVLQFTYFKDVVISNFFYSPAQLLDLGCSDNFSSNILKCIAGHCNKLKTASDVITSVPVFKLF